MMLPPAITLLKAAGIDNPAREANLLLAHILGMTREQLIMEGIPALADSQSQRFGALVQRRANREPMSHLLGMREFYGRNFIVTPDVLDPRPDTETLIDAVLADSRWRVADCCNHYAPHHPTHKKPSATRHPPPAILDLGTGSGCILLTLLAEIPNATGIGVDISEKTLEIARRNTEALGLNDRATFIHDDFTRDVFGTEWGQFDLIVSNPPYIETAAIAELMPEVAQYEPRLALDGGKDGLDCYRKIAIHLPHMLSPHGVAALEIGSTQSQTVADIMTAAGLRTDTITDISNSAIKHDLAGHARCIIITQ